MITIFTLVILFLFIVYLSIRQKEGLMNQYNPINVSNESNANYIWSKLTNPSDELYEDKYTKMNKDDVLLDMKYFNNATNILFAYQSKNIGGLGNKN
jgi:hypothetical protein